MAGVERLPETDLHPNRISATIAHMLAHPDDFYIFPQELPPYRVIEALTNHGGPQEEAYLTQVRIARDVTFSSKVVLHKKQRTLRIRKGKNGLFRALKKAVTWGGWDDAWFEVLEGGSAMETATELRQQIANLRCNIRVVRAGEPPIRTLLLAGAKNAGKSFFVNCLLGKDAADTDSHTRKERFRRYESEAFSIIDTAGANEARADGTPAWGWEGVSGLGKETLGIFVMNYSSHLTTDEGDCLRAFCAFLAEQGLEPPLILVNRMDELYAAPEKKSAVRAATYLRGRLAALGFGTLFVLPVSAMAYRYAVIIEQKIVEAGIGEQTLCGVKKLLRKERDRTMAAFLKEELGWMEDFHGIKDPTIEDVKRASGIPLAFAYLQGRKKG